MRDLAELGPLRGQFAGACLHLFPTPPQGRHQHRLDDEQDVLLAGIVRAELRALVGVKAALEQRAKDRRLDARPVERGSFHQERRPSLSSSSTVASSNSPPSK